MSCPPTTIFSVPGDETCQFLHGISCIHYSLLLKLENVCSLPCLQMMAPLRPLRTITQMPLLNLLLNLLRKCHYSNHYSSLLKGHFHYSSLLSHYALGTLLMTCFSVTVTFPVFRPLHSAFYFLNQKARAHKNCRIWLDKGLGFRV